MKNAYPTDRYTVNNADSSYQGELRPSLLVPVGKVLGFIGVCNENMVCLHT